MTSSSVSSNFSDGKGLYSLKLLETELDVIVGLLVYCRAIIIVYRPIFTCLINTCCSIIVSSQLIERQTGRAINSDKDYAIY
jgi:hypothetical protein